jgi:peptide/nickel transport system substrate-binding protein
VLLENVAQGLVRLDAGGNVVGGLAERWNVSDDGLSYIFRIASAEWSDGRKVTARQVVRALKRQIAPGSNSPLKDALGAVEDIVAMTDRVIEIRLLAPRPNLLPLLAEPEFAILRGGYGTGPFRIDRTAAPQVGLRLTREVASAEEEEAGRHQEVRLSGAPAEQAVRAFAAGKADLVLGGTFADLPYARAVKLPRNSLRFDPSSGLFGLVPVLAGGPLSQPGARRLLNAAIDRAALINALNVPGLAPRATVLEPGLDGVPAPPQPAWFSIPIADRRASLIAEASRLFGTGERPRIRILLPQAPGSDIVFNLIAADWGALGLTVERAKTPNGADFRLLDLVAPSTSPAWFLRQFRCGAVAVCDEAIDQLLDAARQSQVPAQRYALLAQAAGRIDDAQLFIPIAAPIRWSLVSPRIRGFSGNRYARHTLTDLEQKPGNGG